MGRIDKGARIPSRQRRQSQRDSQGLGVEFGDGFEFDPDSGRVSLALDLDPALQFNAGALSVKLKSDGGLNKDADGLFILLATDPGLEIGVSGVRLLIASGQPFTLTGGLGLGLTADGGLEVDTGPPATLGIRLNPTDPGLHLAGGLAVLLDGSSLTLGASGLSVTAPEGRWSVSAVQTGAYTAAAGELVRCDPTGGAFTVTLPTAVGIAGRKVLIKNVTSDTTTITIDGAGAETIDGAASVTITVGYGSVRLVSDGAGWMVV